MAKPYYRYIGKDPRIEPFSRVQQFKSKTYLDQSFMSRGRWETINQQEWFISLVAGMCLTPLILVDIRKCRDWCIKGSDDWHYFNDLLTGKVDGIEYEYITCDGWNRNSTSFAWADNKVLLKKGNYEQEQGYVLNISKDSLKKNLDEHQIAAIDSLLLPVTYITKATRADLGLIFISVNKLVAQNAQELRQALKTDIAEPIRDLATLLEPYFLTKGDGSAKIKSGLITPTNANRRMHDEFILDCVMYVHKRFTKNWTASTRDFEYSKEKSDMKTSFLYAERILKSLLKSGVKTKTIKGKNGDEDRVYRKRSYGIQDLRSLFMTFILHTEIESNNSKIIDGVTFNKWVQTHHTSMLLDKNPPKMIEYEADGTTFKKSFTYKSASRRSPNQVSWGCGIYLDLLSKTDNLIISVDSYRLFSIAQKFELWKIQGCIVGVQDAVCPITKKKIPLDQVTDSSLWQADHIIPHSEGGKTEISNGQLICAVANRAKSNTVGYSLQQTEAA